MKLDFEYGNGMMSAELPDSTEVFIPGQTVKDPPCLPQDWDSLYAATLESIRSPIGMQLLRELAAPGKTVGDEVEFGGLFGRAPIMRVSPYSAEAFIARGGRIPAPLQSLKN